MVLLQVACLASLTRDIFRAQWAGRGAYYQGTGFPDFSATKLRTDIDAQLQTYLNYNTGVREHLFS